MQKSWLLLFGWILWKGLVYVLTIPSAPAPTTPLLPKAVLHEMATWEGKYPYQVELLAQPELAAQLKSMLGAANYDTLTTYWMLESPIVIYNQTLVAEACRAHLCNGTYFILSIHLVNGHCCLGMKVDDQLQIFSSNGQTSEVVAKWWFENGQ